MRVATIGEILWDLIGSQELLGGATFNFSVQLARLGHDVSFISAVGDDDRGHRALEEASRLGLPTKFIRTVKDAPTGAVSVTVDAQGQPSYILHRPAAYDFTTIPEEPIDPEWLYHGTLSFIEPRMRALLKAYPEARRFYDINLRKGSYDRPLVMDLLQRADVVKLNDEELAYLNPQESIEDYASRFHWEAVCVTRGERGCAILRGTEYLEIPGIKVDVVDTVGAGDAFAAAFLHGLNQNWPLQKIGEFANQAGAQVAARAGAL